MAQNERIDLGDMIAVRLHTERERPAPSPRTRYPLHRSVIGLQVIMSTAALAAALVLKYAELPVLSDAYEGLKYALTSEDDYDRMIGRLDFVSNVFSDSTAVFASSSQRLILPVQSAYSIVRGKAFFSCSPGTDVRAVSAGRVFYSSAQSVRIVHPDGYESVYEGVCGSLRTGDVLSGGESLGHALSDGFTLSILRDGKALDADELTSLLE